MIMLQVNISPEMLVGSYDLYPLDDYINKIAPRPSEEFSCSPNGWMYRRDTMGILPREVLKVFGQRKALRKEQLQANSNAEIIDIIIRDRNNGSRVRKEGVEYKVNEFNVTKPFDDKALLKLEYLSSKELFDLERLCRATAKTKNTGQINRKILINSAYGAMANKYFRYMDNRNASAVTMFGQLVIQWAERKINDYINKVIGTQNVKYVFYIDTDSVYVNVEKLVEKIGISKFRDTNHVVDFLDKFARERVEPMLKEAFAELSEYMNNMKSYMNMDREVIAMADIKSDGLGAFWTGKKRYALNVFDNEGVRYAEPQLKIMGIETQRSSTPKIVSKGLEDSIRIMLQDGVKPLQRYVEDYRNEFLMNYRNIDYKEMASVSSANNLEKYSDENIMPIKGCPGHIKGALAYNRIVRDRNEGLPIREGMKIMQLMLNPSNPFKTDRIAWESGENIPYELNDILDHVDYTSVLNKHFFPSLSRITEACNISYEFEDYEGVDEFIDTFF